MTPRLHIVQPHPTPRQSARTLHLAQRNSNASSPWPRAKPCFACLTVMPTSSSIMSFPAAAASEPYTSRMQDQSFFNNNNDMSYNHNNNPHTSPSASSPSPTAASPSTSSSPYPQYLAPQHLTSRETGTPIFGKYAQDGFWDDESDSNTVRQRASTSTAHTVMTHKSTTPKSTATRATAGDKSPAPTLDHTDERPSMFGWAKRPSVANLQAAMGHHPQPQEDRENQASIQKKKSFGKLMGKGKRGELVIQPDLADESVSPPLIFPRRDRSHEARTLTWSILV